jgi:sterol desaturase/sphingolipid hydroxylase (fatty acid hydroxylase superfamily)
MLTYAQWLVGISVFFFVAERLFPWRRQQKIFREGIASDLFYLIFNGHWLGALLSAPWAYGWVKERFDAVLGAIPAPGSAPSLRELFYWEALAAWPLWGQFLVIFFIKDFLEWGIHNLLHRSTRLWEFHKAHHSIHELDWMGVMRFHWMEKIVYDGLKYLILVPLGVAPQVLLWLAIFGTFWGFYTHANLRISLGPLRYVFNSPQMHIWHHAKNDPATPFLCNFGINLSIWDYLFRTAYQPADREAPNAVGFDGDENYPRDAIRQELWPLSRFLHRRGKKK